MNEGDAMVIRAHTTVVRLRLRGAPDPLAARLRIDRVLGQTSLVPPALPPSAILCIRRLSDPLPGSLALHGEISRDGWTRALAAAVARMAERAVRPALGGVTSDAMAIVFLDPAELLACLASDWCDGSLARQWWWQSLFRDADLERLAARVWQQQAERAPAALEHLSRGTRLLPFVGKLDVTTRAVLLDRVTTVFGLPELRSALALLKTEESTHVDCGASGDTGPWIPWVPEAAASLRIDEQCLLGVCLMLHRAPACVRAPTFLQAIRDWRRAPEFTDRGSALVRSRTGSTARKPGVIAVAERPVRARQSNDSGDDADDSSSRLETYERDRQFTTREVSRTTADGRMSADGPLSAGTSEVVSRSLEPRAATAAACTAPATEQVAAADRVAAREAPPAHVRLPASDQSSPFDDTRAIETAPGPAARPVRSTPPAVPIVTRFGGLFYLINVGLFLELYGDFTTPATTGIALSIWDFVAAIGERFVGRRVRRDPVWPLLAQLAGRSDADPPGHDFEPPSEWRVPDAWLDPFPSRSRRRRTSRDGTHRQRHAAGFFLVDVDDRTPNDRRRSYSRFDWWLDRLVAYLRARLARALQVTDRRDACRVLVEHDARVFATDSELHVFFSLAHLPVAIRLSGLDRNPGWVPAAGRRVAFEFD